MTDKHATPSKGFSAIEGPALIVTVATLLVIFLAGSFLVQRGYLAMLPHVMRPTAWLAFALFITAFTASSIQILYRGTYGRWAMKNRRYIGLSFALVHFIHAGLVLSNLAFTEASRTAPVLAGGGMAYVFLALMALTSNNGAVRKMGAKNWKRLHKIGSYYIWLIFMATTVPDLPITWPLGAIIPLVGFLALFLRIAAWRKLRK